MVAVVDDASASSGGLLRDVLARSWRRLHDVGKLEQALIVLVIVTAIYIVVARVSSRGNSKSQKQIILVGPSSSGKTALFTKLVLDQNATTHTSMVESRGWRIAKGGLHASETDCSRLVVDIPGHPRLRSRLLATNLTANPASSLMLIIDAVNGLTAKTIKDAADHLHLLIAMHTLLPKSPKPRKVLICLNKADALPQIITNGDNNKRAFVERSKLALARDMERRRLASVASGTQLGSKVESLSTVVSSKKQKHSNNALLPSDEVELMQVDIWNEQGPWDWSGVEHCPFHVEWALSSLPSIGLSSDVVTRWIDST